MPNTITAFHEFVAGTTITASSHNENFSNFRGTMIPIDPNTAAAADNSYDLGTTEYRWRKLYAVGLDLATGSTSNLPTWDKYSLSYTDLQTAAASASPAILTLAAKGVIHNVIAKMTTQFQGGGLTSVKVAVGTSSDNERYMTYLEVNTTTASKVTSAIGIEDFTATTAIELFATASGANLDSLTGGDIDVYVLRSDLP